MNNQEQKQKLIDFAWDMCILQNMFSIPVVQEYVRSVNNKKKTWYMAYDYHKDFDRYHDNTENHWVLKNKNYPTIKHCSIEDGIQNIHDDSNDNLCQIYCVMDLLNIKLPKHLKKDDEEQKIAKHKQMVSGLRKLINSNGFVKFLQLKSEEIQNDFEELQNDLDEIQNDLEEIDFDNEIDFDITRINYYFITRSKTVRLIKVLNNILDDWHSFGYRYFIGDGK